MSNWQTSLTANPIPWLLEPSNPSVRYFTLTNLLDRPADDPEVRDARAAIADSDVVQAICARQRPDGAWLGKDFYVPKGMATFWRLCLLGEVGLRLSDKTPVMRAACECVFRHQQIEGCFQRVRKSGSKFIRDRAEIPCIQARLVRALIQVGYGDDPRTKRAIGWLVRTQREDGGWLCSGPKPTHSCVRATIDYVRAVELFPAMKNNPATLRAANLVASLLLADNMGRFHVADAWTALEFPYFNYSLIPTLLALLRLGLPADHPNMAPALDYVRERQEQDGAWKLDSAPRNPADLGRPGEPNKWLTLDALRVLRAAAA